MEERIALDDCGVADDDIEKKYCNVNDDEVEGIKTVDYVLVYNEDSDGNGESKKKSLRDNFENQLTKKHQIITSHYQDIDGKTYYTNILIPFDRLCIEAEHIKLKLPLDIPCKAPIDDDHNFLKWFRSIPDEDDYYSGYFQVEKLSSFRGYEDQENFFSRTHRSALAYSILSNTRFGKKSRCIGIGELIKLGAYSDAYPLHSGAYDGPDANPNYEENPRKLLYDKWARNKWYSLKRFQPIDQIRSYFGEKVAIYFLWLGTYTTWLLFPSIIGVIVFFYGLSSFGNSKVSDQICTSKYTLCSPYEGHSGVPLNSTCSYAKFSEIFDNVLTLPFAVIMSLWATLFVEFWKRTTASTAFDWDISGLEKEEVNRPMFVGTSYRKNPVTNVVEEYYPRRKRYLKYFLSFSALITMLCVVVITVIAIIFYRLVVQRELYFSLVDSGENIAERAPLVANMTGSLFNLIFIMIFNKIYSKIAFRLTDWENHKTETKYEDHLIVKLSLFEFVNSYAAVVYVAFFQGRFGTPDKPVRFLGYRMEACPSYGCMAALTMQLAMLLILKPLIGAAVEVGVPWIQKFRRERKLKRLGKADNQLQVHTQWERDKRLMAFPGVRNEYLEMVIQFGYMTIFVVAFPLGPLCAFVNNIVEIRTDAARFVCLYRRPPGIRAEDIGTWAYIIEVVVKLSVISNGMVIAFTSDVLPRIHYWWNSEEGSMDGYIDSIYTLSRDSGSPCYFRGHYEDTPQYWELIAVKMAFVLVFEHLVCIVTQIVAIMVPDVPRHVQEAKDREHHEAKSLLNRSIYDKTDSQEDFPDASASSDIIYQD